jgi:hypothetical protein
MLLMQSGGIEVITAQEPMTWGLQVRIRFRHLRWIFAAQGGVLLALWIWGSGAYLFIPQGLVLMFFCLHLTWLTHKGIGCKQDKVMAGVFLVLAIPFAFGAGFVGVLYVCTFLFGP